jgi:hypothetical protein
MVVPRVYPLNGSTVGSNILVIICGVSVHLSLCWLNGDTVQHTLLHQSTTLRTSKRSYAQNVTTQDASNILSLTPQRRDTAFRNRRMWGNISGGAYRPKGGMIIGTKASIPCYGVEIIWSFGWHMVDTPYSNSGGCQYISDRALIYQIDAIPFSISFKVFWFTTIEFDALQTSLQPPWRLSRP